MSHSIYELPFKVRDYECDLQGIVNNANYQHYLEHTRHEFMLQEGLSFSAMHEQGIDAVVARVDIRYKIPLRSRDEFVCKLNLSREGIKYVFLQDIFRLPDNKHCVKARIETVCLNNGKLDYCEEIDQIINKYNSLVVSG